MTRDDVLAALNGIIDPCSVRAGLPAGLADMGLITELRIAPRPEGLSIQVEVTVTELGCFMIIPFEGAVRDAIGALPGVADVAVDVKADPNWSEDRLSDTYRSRLRILRSRRRSMLSPPAGHSVAS
ncbi:MAG TPA: iron-sulfur cluster assembly protein [Solirubrobacteraceae bacterium]|jgi:metal-sulfur cluster biosynthetic enzyme